MWKERVMTIFVVPFRYLPRGILKNHKNLQSDQSVSWPRFKTCTSQIQAKVFTTCSALLAAVLLNNSARQPGLDVLIIVAYDISRWWIILLLCVLQGHSFKFWLETEVLAIWNFDCREPMQARITVLMQYILDFVGV